MDADVKQWSAFFDRCLIERLEVEKFTIYANHLIQRYPAERQDIARLLLKPRWKKGINADPKVIQYAIKLLEIGVVDVPDILRALLKTSRCSPARTDVNNLQNEDAHGVTKSYNSPELEEIIFLRLSKAFTTNRRPKSKVETWEVIDVISRWMSVVMTTSATDEMMQSMDGQSANPRPEALAIRESLGMLLVTVAENPKVIAVLNGSCPKKIRQSFARTLSLYIPFISQTHHQIGDRLDNFQRNYQVFDEGQIKTNGMHDILGGINANGFDQNWLNSLNIIDGPYVTSRAGLYIFLNAALVGQPLMDDQMVLNYLNARYRGDVPASIVDLITASFDILTNATQRNESGATRSLLRSFLINKVPKILTVLAGSLFPPLTAELCISQAMKSVDPDAFPSLSSMFDLTDSNIIPDTRQDFLFACCLHGLVAESSIEQLLGEEPMQTLPSVGRYTEKELLNRCLVEPGKLESLVGELEDTTGNSGAIANTVTQVIQQLCTGDLKDTMSLKSLCFALARKPSALDVMLLFNSAETILYPICRLLDEWRYEEDQGEYQPVYEEFGGILLLLLAFVHRYDLTPADLGVDNPDSFITRLLNRGYASYQVDALSDEQKKHLGVWIHGLFEVEEITDEVMSACPPQQFYLLVPTIFHQSIIACKAKVMEPDSLKGALDYLLETFLLPSLVTAMIWMTRFIWEAQDVQDDMNTAMQIIKMLITPRSISGEAQTMHSAIISIIAKPLERALRPMQRHKSLSSDVAALIAVLQTHATFSRTPASSLSEAESWTATHGGGLAMSLRNTFQSFVLWSSTANISMTPTPYTHRQFLLALQILGAKPVLHTLVSELKEQYQSGAAPDLALDIAISFVCAPNAGHHSQGRMTIRQALSLELEEAPNSLTQDPLRVEVLVRLSRRVDAQSGNGQLAMANSALIDQVNMDVAAVEVGNMVSNVDLVGVGVDANINDVIGGAVGNGDSIFDGLDLDDPGAMDLS
ncbi:MAG: mediator complex subunit [Vezdaea acicularis]|nr:MAG: mediator complex subunit [Vezdaea acicularis]